MSASTPQPRALHTGAGEFPLHEYRLRLLEALEADGWSVALAKWSVGEESAPRAVGVFELAPPR